jgi:hypothetical protein
MSYLGTLQQTLTHDIGQGSEHPKSFRHRLNHPILPSWEFTIANHYLTSTLFHTPYISMKRMDSLHGLGFCIEL